MLDRAVELFKQRALKEAELQRCEFTTSFEVLTRDVEGFPKRVVQNSTWVVDSWGEGVSAECWFCATRGTTTPFPGTPVIFAELACRYGDKIRGAAEAAWLQNV